MNVRIANAIEACVDSKAVQILVTPPDTNPLALAAVGTCFRKATVMAFKTKGGGANTGAVKIGPSAVAGEQVISLAAGASYVLEAPVGARWDLHDWYLVIATAGDGVVVVYS